MKPTIKGNIGEQAVLFEASKRELFAAAMPEGCPYDIVVDKDGKLNRIQVKYSVIKNGCIRIEARSSTGVAYDNSNIDAIICYCATNGKTYWIDAAIIAERSRTLNLRVDAPDRNRKNINWASEYEVW